MGINVNILSGIPLFNPLHDKITNDNPIVDSCHAGSVPHHRIPLHQWESEYKMLIYPNPFQNDNCTDFAREEIVFIRTLDII